MATNVKLSKQRITKPFNCVTSVLIAICALVGVFFAGKSAVNGVPHQQTHFEEVLSDGQSIADKVRIRNIKVRSVLDGINSRGADDLSVASWKPTVAISSRSDALDSLTGGDLVPAAGEKKYMLVKKKPKHKKIKMEVYEPKMKYKKIKMKVPVKVMKKKKVKGYMVKKHHHYEH